PRGKWPDAGYRISIPPQSGRWQKLEIEAQGSSVTVHLDGQLISDDSAEPASERGYIALGSTGSGRLQVRNIQLKPLGLGPIYNGSDLDGWKFVAPPEPEKKADRKILKVIPLPKSKKRVADWSVRAGVIHVQNGQGQLETAPLYDDFVLQMDVRSNGTGESRPSAGVLLRGEPGKYGSGYEIRVHNKFNGDRAKPADVGTGGIYRFHPARRVISDERAFFTLTAIASNRHLQVWVNGYPVADFEDRRPAGNNIAREARLGKGPIALMAVDETDADLRNLRIASLSKPPQPVPPTSPTIPTAPPSAGQQVAPPAAPPALPPTSGDNTLAQQIAQQNLTQQQEQQKEQRVSSLMQQALGARTPQEKVRTYDQILALDPNNQVAYNARQDAQQRIEQEEQARSAGLQQQQKQQHEVANREQRRKEALRLAEGALLRGDFSQARTQAGLAEQMAPQDPETRRLLSLIDNRLQVRSRILYAVFGTSSLCLIGMITLFVRRRRRGHPVLEVVDGIGKGQEIVLKDNVTRIGAVAGEGNDKNDLVLDDQERSVSRFHCEIHRMKKKVYILDCGSSNGTYVDGRRLHPEQPARIGNGSRIRLGRSCTLRVGYRR
ncbi:MAG TPA: family 16 glycoside hydrolase, partial [Bryobacteraceae bacterium]|nr:family 16 glycoside hydrolase [Bryobacteraceae bacterium]